MYIRRCICDVYIMYKFLFIFQKFRVTSTPPFCLIPFSRRREHLHARALQIRAELSTHIHRETGPQRPTHSF